jgi:hypothetical protein
MYVFLVLLFFFSLSSFFSLLTTVAALTCGGMSFSVYYNHLKSLGLVRFFFSLALLLTFLFGFDILLSAWHTAKALGLFACSFSSTNVILLCTTCQTYNSFYHYSYSFKKLHAECFSRFLNLFISFLFSSFLATKSQEA